ncbi:MAG TPA: dipeptide/oligopeptide/nickel ABC transporter ATP-binding protein [Firmicutes bacterium]|nr:dipeptide/oligopeptide/nickel ABC transporter ATP-binding protein [Bacillota bacterium]
MSVCLRAEHLYKTFSRREGRQQVPVPAAQDLSLVLEEGDSLGIIGTSGCGKTTLVRMILGLLSPDRGTVERTGTVGFVGQDPYASLCASMTVEQIVAEPLLFSGRARRTKDCRPQVEEALASVRLDPARYAGRRPAQLSGGERQRVSIARAVILQPSLLVLDEPTSMLDQEVKEEVAQVIQDASHRRGMAFLMVTHDILLAGRICRRLVVMQEGRFVEEGEAAALLAHPREPLTQDLIRIGSDLRSYWAQRYGIGR